MAGIIGLLIALIVAGGGVWTVVDGVTNHRTHRDCDLSTHQQRQPVLYSINTTNFRGQDAQRLHNLTMNVLPSGKAIRGMDFESEGDAFIAKEHTKPGFLEGGLSFYIPGTSKRIDGEWLAVDPMTEETENDVAFRDAHEKWAD